MVIWGTDVIVDHCQRKFTKFLQKFVNEEVDEDEALMDMGTQLPFYMARLEEVWLSLRALVFLECSRVLVLLTIVRFLVCSWDREVERLFIIYNWLGHEFQFCNKQ